MRLDTRSNGGGLRDGPLDGIPSARSSAYCTCVPLQVSPAPCPRLTVGGEGCYTSLKWVACKIDFICQAHAARLGSLASWEY